MCPMIGTMDMEIAEAAGMFREHRDKKEKLEHHQREVRGLDTGLKENQLWTASISARRAVRSTTGKFPGNGRFGSPTGYAIAGDSPPRGKSSSTRSCLAILRNL